jgi:hypothetical protein
MAANIDRKSLQTAARELSHLDALPAVVTMREAVRRMLPAIRAARAKGYTWPAIAERLAAAGVEIKANTLTGYATEYTVRRGPKTRRQLRKPQELKA